MLEARILEAGSSGKKNVGSFFGDVFHQMVIPGHNSGWIVSVQKIKELLSAWAELHLLVVIIVIWASQVASTG